MGNRSTAGIIVVACVISSSFASDETGAYIKPEGAVRKVGDEVKFDCRSPENYTTHNYQEIIFKLQKNGDEIFESEPHRLQAHKYTFIEFAKIVSKHDSGNYTCVIIPSGSGKRVTVWMSLFIVEVEDKTVFVKSASEAEISCLDTDVDFSPKIDWYVDNEKMDTDDKSDKWFVTSDSNLRKSSVDVDDSKSNIYCVVTSEIAYDNYGSVEASLRNGSAARINRTLSVISVPACSQLPCQLQASVYGVTPVNISWIVDHEPVNSSLSVNKNVTTSTAGMLNSTVPVVLIITGGGNSWSENITLKRSSKQEGLQGLLVAVIAVCSVAVVAVAVVGLVIFLCCKNKCCDNPCGTAEHGNGRNQQEEEEMFNVQNADVK